ncbi:hypothetical protein BC936DRAFT_140297 [Jimgerdemannia flammicorona]|uniref:Uncharacterized protein n=1 Tax=Jimgerdemannia flammicorona TaxID=994334 RepID=A0A433AVN7_9FUNG|nr:hypothetical protein BC936DRAFT_140297 [Jimgerdemannia flammicorona]
MRFQLDGNAVMVLEVVKGDPSFCVFMLEDIGNLGWASRIKSPARENVNGSIDERQVADEDGDRTRCTANEIVTEDEFHGGNLHRKQQNLWYIDPSFP